MGSAVHEALATYHRALKRGDSIHPQEIQQSFLETWIDREDQQHVTYKSGESRDDLIAQGISLLELYQKEPPPLQIMLIEQSFLVPLTCCKLSHFVANRRILSR